MEKGIKSTNRKERKDASSHMIYLIYSGEAALSVLPGLITDGHNCNNIKYGDDTVFMVDTERKI